MQRIITKFLLFVFFSAPAILAQEMDLPESWFLNIQQRPETISLSPIDMESIVEEDFQNDRDKSTPWRYGILRDLNIDCQRNGSWTVFPDGSKMWQLIIHSPDALNLSFIFDNFFLPQGAKFIAFNESHTDVTNNYSSLQYPGENRLGTWFIDGDTVWLEYFQPAGVQGTPILQLSGVIHGYRLGKLHAFLNAERGYNDSGDCHFDVDCEIGEDFDALKDELKKAVALLNLGNGFLCSGVLVNNTKADKTPYLLTANHCLEASDPKLWSMRFNWISPNPVCGVPEISANNTSNLTLSGATLKANNRKSDFALVKLDHSIPDSWDVAFAGWNNTDEDPLFEVGIHHPMGDIMKVCRDNSGAEKIELDGKSIWLIGGGTQGRGNGWEIGTTEKGSSGSPLFNEKGQMIGQLYGGDSGCFGTQGNGNFDAYGRFAVSWNSGTDPASRLKEWLDPINSGQSSMETLQNILNVPDHLTKEELSVYPNPASTTITVMNNQFPHLQYEFYTLLGQKMSSGKVSNTLNQINVENLAAGLYILRLFDDSSQESVTKKILISR